MARYQHHELHHQVEIEAIYCDRTLIHYGLCRFVESSDFNEREKDILRLFISNATPTRLTRFIKGINKPDEVPGFWFHRLDKESRVKHLLKIQKMLDL